MKEDLKIGFIGAGNIGSAIITGLLNADVPASNLFVSHPSADKNKKYKHLNIENESADNEFVVNSSDVIFLCVKPQIIESVCTSISHLIDSKRHIIISVAAGVNLKKLESILTCIKENKLRLVRCMLNTAALIGSSCSVYSQNGYLGNDDKALVNELLSSTGPCMGEIKDTDMDAAMAVLSCGIAYHFMMTVSFFCQVIRR